MFDTHAHLNLPPLLDDVGRIVDESRSAGVTGINVIGIDVQSSRAAVGLAGRFPGYLHAVVGIQPNSLNDTADGDFDRIAALLDHPGVVAMGETGLDTYWKEVPLERQRPAFDWHMDRCVEHDLPMVIHMRDCGGEILRSLDARDAIPRGVMHSFSGDASLAQHCLDRGLHISLAGMVTFKNAGSLIDVARMVPDDRLLVETDSPYLSPEPLRGKRPNVPVRVEHTLRRIAEIRGVDTKTLARTTAANARRLFGISDAT